MKNFQFTEIQLAFYNAIKEFQSAGPMSENQHIIWKKLYEVIVSDSCGIEIINKFETINKLAKQYKEMKDDNLIEEIIKLSSL